MAKKPWKSLLIPVLAALQLSACSSASKTVGKLREASAPTQEPARSIGTYDAGCLAGASTLPLQGLGFAVMRTARNRYHGHPELIAFLNDLAAQASRAGLGTLLIGDLGQPRGGPMLTGHKSHQIGLDADIWFRLIPGSLVPLATSQPDTFEALTMLRPDQPAPTADPRRFGVAQSRLLKLAAQDERVSRIFVNPALKLELCALTPAGSRAWLEKLRPWSGHDSHFHVRLHCPAGQPDCAEQAPPPPGDGCEEAKMLAQYFRELEAREKLEPPAPPREILLPEACEKIAG